MEKREQTLRELMESESYAKQKAVIQEEINSNKLEIDRSVFSKDDEEYARTETAKYHWRKQIQKEGHTKRNFKQKIYFKS